MPFIHEDVQKNLLSRDPSHRHYLEFFEGDFQVTWGNVREIFNSRIGVFFLKPLRDFSDAFGVENEILLLHSPYQTLQARTLQMADQILGELPAKGRVEPLIFILVSAAQDLFECLKRFTADNRQSRIPVPFLEDECLEIRNPLFARKRFQEHLFVRDLFDVSQPISSDVYFFGRKSLVLELRDSLRAGENIGLFGLRKMGKTSIIFRLKRFLEHEGEARLTYVDLQDARLYSLRWWELMEEIRGLLMDEAPRRNVTPVDSAKRFRRSAQDWKAENPGRTAVIALDEVEHISPALRMKEHWDQDFLEFWKTMRAVQNENRHLAFLVAGVNASCIESASYGGHDNPLFSMAKVRYLPAFNQEELDNMITTLGRIMGLRFTQESVGYLEATYGGHPMLTRMACSYFHKGLGPGFKRPTQVTEASFRAGEATRDEALFHLGGQILSVLEQWYPQEYEMLKWLAEGEVQVFRETAQEIPQCAQHLQAYQLVSGDPPRFTIPLLAKHIRGISHERATPGGLRSTSEVANSGIEDLADIGRLRNRLEPLLRRFVKAVLKVHLGPERWVDAVLDCIDEKRREKLKGVAADVILKDRVFLLDLVVVIDKHWDKYFKQLESGDPRSRITKNQCRVLLDFVNTHREDAHAKAVSETDLATLKAVVPLLERTLRGFLEE